MQKIRFKNMLLISITILVGLSVSITSYVSYIGERQELINHVFKENSEYVRKQAKFIENKLAEKILGFTKVTTLYDGLMSTGTKEEFIKLLNTIAFSMNLNSAAIAFEDGKSYWNQTSDLWPDHSFIGDVEVQSYYLLGRSSSSVAVTEPYDDAGVYWTSIVHNIQNGVMSADIRLDFLSKFVDTSNDMPGTVAFILNHDTTILASSNQDVETTMLATKYPWFKEIALGAVSKETSVQPYQSDGVDKLFFTHRIKVADKNWYYTLGLDTEVAYAKLAEEKKNSIISTFVAVLISVALTFILLQIIYSLILELKEKIISIRTKELSEANKRLRIQSNTDGLTNINNRRYFDTMLNKEWKRGLQSNAPLAIIMLDIDNFKSFNDKYGHLVGDDCIQKLAQGLSQSLHREADVVARFGGEEFVVLLPQMGGQEAFKVAKHLQEIILSLAIPHEISSTGVVTVSFGVASVLPSSDKQPIDLVGLADNALYRAKAAGRNCIKM